MPDCGNCCGQEGTKRCSNCKTVYYCSRKCQISHWKSHKKTCKEIKSTLEEETYLPRYRTNVDTNYDLSRRVAMLSTEDRASIPQFHEEYRIAFSHDAMHYKQLETQWNSDQLSYLWQKLEKYDKLMPLFGTVKQVLTKRWAFWGPELLQYLQTSPKVGTIFLAHPFLDESCELEYGIQWFNGIPIFCYQTMRNTPVHLSVFEYGKTYVSVGFVDLEQLINAKFIPTDEERAKKVTYICYEMSEIAVARSKIILELLNSEVSVEIILQIWFSTCLSSSAQTVLQKVCQTLSVKEEDATLKNLFAFWNCTKMDVDSAMLRWSQYLSDSEMQPLNNLLYEQDRVEYARYLLTGQIFIGEKEKPSSGNSTMFELPKEYRNYKKAADNFFSTISMDNFSYSKSLMFSVAERTINGAQILRKLLKEEKINIILKVQKFDKNQESLCKEVKNLEPKSIEWSNIPDYMSPGQFLTMAEKCSSEGTTHTFHTMNWRTLVYGASIFDYFPLNIYGDYFSDDNGKVAKKFKELEKEYNNKFISVKSSQPFLRQDKMFENVINISENILCNKFKDCFIDFMFKETPVESLEAKMETFNVFATSCQIVSVAFKFCTKPESK